MGESGGRTSRDETVRMRLLTDLARSLSRTIDPERLLRTVVETIEGEIALDDAHIWILSGDVMRLEASVRRNSGWSDVVVPLGEGLLGNVAGRSRGDRSGDVTTDPRVIGPIRDRASAEGLHSQVSVPLDSSDEHLGVLALWSTRRDAYSDDDLAFLEAVGVQIGGALDSARRFLQVMELERLKADFIARISHELRTPITIITGFLDTVLNHDQQIEPEARRHMLQRSQAAADRLADLIGDLLTLSKIETGVLPIDRRLIELQAVLTTIANDHPDGAVTLHDLPDSTTTLSDATLLQQAIGHVVDNAVKYADQAEIKVVPGDRGTWTVSVIDHGPGIPDDVRPVIFEVFTRSERTTEIPGLGLGLAMARTILGALGGDVVLSDTEGGGTTVDLIVPNRQRNPNADRV